MEPVPNKSKRMYSNIKIEVQADLKSPSVTKIHTGEALVLQNGDTCVDMPSLVFSILVKNTRDVGALKGFRIVSKSWNEQACHALRTHSFVRLEEKDPDRLKKFRNLLLEGRFFALPSPFQNFHVEASTFSDDTFTTLINLQKLIIINLSVTTPYIEELNWRMFETVYKDNRATIREFSFKETEGWNESTVLLKNKQLELEDNCYQYCSHKDVFLKRDGRRLMEGPGIMCDAKVKSPTDLRR
ncbi:unnamed protein product [Allacma fusca]|uniref:Uncharacterized protein n=1 Tax=Allacma fusca TaxID=39272 RepID=A0A8J2J594_9HEXA|nr:unnamed protein product [Allacma fusca]